MPTTYSYFISDVPDLDQRWKALPGEGSMYCVPTSAMDWLYYVAKHGVPRAVVFPDESDKNKIVANLAMMGAYMKTHPKDGTTGDGAVDGLEDYLDDFDVSANVKADSGYVFLDDLELWTLVGGLVMVTRGRYFKLDVLGDAFFFRDGGHVMPLIGLERTAFGEADMTVRDPADDTQLGKQSKRSKTKERVKEQLRTIAGQPSFVLRWPDSDFRFIDGWTAIVPQFALTNSTAKAIMAHSAGFGGKAIETRKLALPFDGEVADLALHPAAPRAAVIARGSGEVWTVDIPRATWRKTATLTAPRLLTYGGRDRRLFVVQGKEVLAFDRAGKALGKLDAGAAIEAISYDQKNDRLIAAVASAKRLLAVAPELRLIGETEAPEVPGSGRLALSVNGRDATIVLSREGSPEAATLRWEAAGARTAGGFRLQTEGRTAAAHVNRKGRLFAAEDGKIATFDADGKRVAGSVFDGLPAGPLLKVSRSSHNFDPARSQQKEWMNGGA
jgi:hypothetical protein